MLIVKITIKYKKYSQHCHYRNIENLGSEIFSVNICKVSQFLHEIKGDSEQMWIVFGFYIFFKNEHKTLRVSFHELKVPWVPVFFWLPHLCGRFLT